MICKSCGKEIDDGSKFCPECGTKVILKKICPNCGTEVDFKQKFCSECGCSLSTDVKESSKVENEESEEEDEIDYSELSIDELEILGKKNDSEALYELGERYANGTGVEKNEYTAFEYYQKSADLGNALAISSIGDAFYYGDGVNVDKEEAVNWYERAVEMECLYAMYRLGYCYLLGAGVTKNPKKAVELFEKSKIITSSMYWIGRCYYSGWGVNENKEKAFKYFLEAAEQGHGDAYRCVGLCYYNGNGVEEDKDLGISYLEIAANPEEYNNSDAQLYLGRLYLGEFDEDRADGDNAIKYLKLAVDNDETEAKVLLAICYHDGDLIEEDREECRRLLTEAKSDGNKEAEELLDAMDKELSHAIDDLVEERRQKKIDVVAQYISDVNTSGVAYTHGAVNNPEYAQVIQSAITHMAPGIKQSDIIGLIDTTLFGKGKAGLLFTYDNLIYKSIGASFSIAYADIDMEIKGSNITFRNTRQNGTGLMGGMDCYIDEFNTKQLTKMLFELKNASCLEGGFII